MTDLAAFENLLDEWHAPIGHAVLGTFDLTDGVLKAVADHESAEHSRAPRTLSEVIIVANLLSKMPNPLNRDGAAPRGVAIDTSATSELLESSAAKLVALVAALRA